MSDAFLTTNARRPMADQTPTEAARRFAAVWNAGDENERASLLEAITSPEVAYVDPHAPGPVSGRSGILDVLRLFRSRFDHDLVLGGEPSAHNGFFHFRWRLERPDGDTLSTGATFGELDDQGQIVRIVQFVD